jgi:hypothetical protein
VAAFYPLPRCLFYRVGGFHWGRVTIVFMRPPVRSEVKKVVYRMSEILFAAEIAFRRLNGCMAQQELNLLQLATARVAQLRTGSPQVMRCNMLQARSLAAGLYYVPHDILRDAFPPHLSRSGDGSKDHSTARRPLSCCKELSRTVGPRFSVKPPCGLSSPSFARWVAFFEMLPQFFSLWVPL